MRFFQIAALTLFCPSLFAAPEPLPMAQAQQQWAAEIKDGQQAMGALIGKLGPQLQAAMKSGGPVKALDVCAQVAQPLTASANLDRAIKVGRSSHRLRNPANSASEWVAKWLAANTPGKAADARPVVYDLGDRIGIVKAIPTQAVCLKCHGEAAGLPEQVRSALADRYPHDQATGFREGDIRGVIWAEVPKQTP